MSEHAELSRIYIYMSRSSSDVCVSLSFALKAIEEAAFHVLVESGEENVYTPETQRKMMGVIRGSIREVYVDVLKEMVNATCGLEVRKDILDEVEKAINTLILLF